MTSKKIKDRYVQLMGVVILILALGRCTYDGFIKNDDSAMADEAVAPIHSTGSAQVHSAGSAQVHSAADETSDSVPQVREIVKEKEERRFHRIYSVSDYQVEFPDTNALQLTAARMWGVTPVESRADAEKRQKELVYVGLSPYYHVDPLQRSIPYLVPRAAILLQDIGQSFYDSLQVKGVPLHKLIVTSVLRSQEDIRKLRNYNKNATENSCHLYGTTFDICYNRYITVEDPDGPRKRQVRNDSLKWILSEVLRDMRANGRCYVKYERKQSCFHLTVR